MILLIVIPTLLLIAALCVVPTEPDELPPISRKTMDRLEAAELEHSAQRFHTYRRAGR
jgi:hypothetical protein